MAENSGIKFGHWRVRPDTFGWTIYREARSKNGKLNKCDQTYHSSVGSCFEYLTDLACREAFAADSSSIPEFKRALSEVLSTWIATCIEGTGIEEFKKSLAEFLRPDRQG